MDKLKYVDAEVFEQIKNYTISAEDIYLSIAGTIGKTGFISKELDGACLTENACKLVLSTHVLKEYLYYYTLSDSFLEATSENTRTAAQPKLSLKRIKTIPIPLPSIEEQKRIVAILDEAFEGLDRARTHTEANLQNAKELFESALAVSMVGNWMEKRFDEVCVLQRGFDLPKRLRKTGKYDLVTSSGIKDTHSEAKVIGPGVATGRSGSIGKVFYVQKDFWPLNTALYIKEFHGNIPKFIWYFLRHFKLNRFSSGAGVPTLNRNDVHGELVKIPTDTTEQQTIIDNLDLLEKTCDKLSAQYQSKLKDLDDLRQSLLQKAFAGELT